MRNPIRAIVCLVLALAVDPAAAAVISTAPVTLEIPAPRKSGKLTLQTWGEDELAIQIRVFKWDQKDGKDRLVPTKDVVASPPMAKLKPDTRYTVRIVRVGAAPVQSEESYRLLIDQLPKPARQPSSQVNFLIRQSIPLFFSAAPEPRASLRWTAALDDGLLVVAAKNEGGRRARLSNLSIETATGVATPPREGLAGYVLAGSAAEWVQRAPKGLAAGSRLTIRAQDEYGPIEAGVTIKAAD
jgi:fimbrial chaperone protein